MKHAKTEKTQYYRCRPCNNASKKKFIATEAGKKAARRALDSSNARYPEKRSARSAVWWALKTNKLKKSSVCEACGDNVRIEGHHLDYTKPLEVLWLCPSCHSSYHKV